MNLGIPNYPRISGALVEPVHRPPCSETLSALPIWLHNAHYLIRPKTQSADAMRNRCIKPLLMVRSRERAPLFSHYQSRGRADCDARPSMAQFCAVSRGPSIVRRAGRPMRLGASGNHLWHYLVGDLGVGGCDAHHDATFRRDAQANPSISRCACHSSGRLAARASRCRLSCTGCRPSKMAAVMSGAR